MGRTGLRRLNALTLAVAVAACSGAPASIEPSASATSQPTPAASPSAAPTQSATQSTAPSPTAPPVAEASPTANPDPCSHKVFDGPWTIDPLVLGSAVRVDVAELNLRAGPCTGARIIDTVRKGDVLIVNPYPYGPLKGNGYPWYMVYRLQFPGADGGLPPLPLPPAELNPGFNDLWVAANDGARPYVVPLPPRCPTQITFENVRAMLPAERLACFEGPFELQGTFGCGGCGGSGGPNGRPQWLAPGWETNNLRIRWADGEEPISIFFKPRGPEEPPAGSIIRVKVHVDDPAAVNCAIEWTIINPQVTIPDEIAIPYCRERIVVDSYEIVGEDPNFPR